MKRKEKEENVFEKKELENTSLLVLLRCTAILPHDDSELCESERVCFDLGREQNFVSFVRICRKD